MCYLQKVSTLLKNGNVCQPSSLQTNVLREKKTKGKSLEETGVSNWRLRLDELDQAKPFWGKTFHQSSSEKYIADSAAGDSVQRSVSMRGGSLVKTFPSPFRVYPLFLLSTDSNDVLISTLELKLEQQPLNNLGPQGSNIFIPSLPPPPPYCGIKKRPKLHLVAPFFLSRNKTTPRHPSTPRNLQRSVNTSKDKSIVW